MSESTALFLLAGGKGKSAVRHDSRENEREKNENLCGVSSFFGLEKIRKVDFALTVKQIKKGQPGGTHVTFCLVCFSLFGQNVVALALGFG